MANHTILIIDYEPRSIERFRDPLVAAGYTIEIATDGISGVEAFHRLNPDMVLVEAMIPKKHGFEVCQDLKRTPHGRRTPVLITTSVYKGRKYRTQALHIYGCDEYIEKPIAPEQLLEVVGKFFGSAASAPSEDAAEPASVPSQGSGDRASHATEMTNAQSTPSADLQPHPFVKDDGEDEITALLDAILPGGSVTPRRAEPSQLAVAATSQLPAEPIEEDPFALIRAELNADLGSFSGALAVEPTVPDEPAVEAIPSDQVVSPSVFEALPEPEAGAPGRVVSFDTKRPRKSGRNKKSAKPTPEPVATPADEPVFSAPVFSAPAESAATVTLPRGTMVETELNESKGRRGMPVWVWVGLGVFAVVGAYVAFSRGTVTRVEAPPPPPPQQTIAVEAQTAAPTSLPSLPVEQPPSAVVVESRKPEPTTLKAAAPAPKKSPDRAPAPASKSKRAPAQIPTSVPEPLATAPVHAPKTETQTPSGLGDNVAGIENVPDPAAAGAPTAVVPGALVPIDEADVMPVGVTRRPPSYSTQARALQLSGTVIMNVLVNERGTVDQVVLVTGVPGADVNDSAMRAAKAWTYRPATKRGVPVKVWKSEQVTIPPG